MTRYSRLFITAVTTASLAASPISAQLRGGLGGVIGGVTGGVRTTIGQASGTVGGVTGIAGQTAGGVLGGVSSGTGALGSAVNQVTSGLSQSRFLTGPVSLNQVSAPFEILSASPVDIENYRVARLRALIDSNRRVLDRDPDGAPVRRYELICTNPDSGSLALAARTGFQVVGDEQEPGLGLRLVTLSVPKGMNVRQALALVRRTAPSLQVDYNHVYEPSGGSLLPVAGARLAAAAALRGQIRIAMIDGGVAAHPALARASIEQRGFAGDAQPTGHGTAVGSLLVGEQGPFHGAARGAQLFVGDVYGGNPAAGTATAIVRALSWAATKNPQVINVSLVGPSNSALARAIAAVEARGIQVVAAVGNDGPASPPQFPASYPGVVSVTGVDAQGRALPEAGKAAHLDFAAPGADMIAAYPGEGYEIVRGTSFAAPLAAARLAIAGSYQRLTLEARPGRGKVGRGIVCADCRTDPKVTQRK
jgi:hypothetical protein